MATLDNLIDDLRSDGAVESEGHFTLDRAQARAKMQKYQLADPRRYVLELVQAAVLRGATYIAFEIDADDMRMRFNGEPFRYVELDDLYGSLFRDGKGPALEGVRQLAVALNAAVGMEPKFIALRSGGVELDMVPGQEDVLTNAPGPVENPHTTLHVKQRLRPRVVLNFFWRLMGELGEEQYLRERCRYSSVRLSLNGTQINHGLTSEQAEGWLAYAGPGYIGTMRLRTADKAESELRLVKDGVWIDSRNFPTGGRGITAVVESTALRKDVSQAKIVSNAFVKTLIKDTLKARWQLLAEARAAARIPKVRVEIDAVIREQLLAHVSVEELWNNEHVGALTPRVGWQDSRDSSRSVSLAELVATVRAGQTCRWTKVHYYELEAEGAPVILLAKEEAKHLFRLFGDKLVEADDMLARSQRREKGRKAWRARVGEPVLPTHVETLARGPLELDAGPSPLRGEVGIDRDSTSASLLEHPVHMLLYKDGCLLGRLELELDIPNLWLVVEADFNPTDDYRDAIRDRVFVHAILQGLAAARQPLAQALYDTREDPDAGKLRGLAKRWLIGLLDPSAQAALLASAGVDLTPGHHVSVQALLPELLMLERSEPDAAPRLIDRALFHQVDGLDLSLRELGTRVARDGQLAYLPSRPKDPRVQAQGVLVLGPGDRKIVRSLWGEEVLEAFDIEPALRQIRHAEQAPFEWAERFVELSVAGAQTQAWPLCLPDREFVLLPAYGEHGVRDLEDEVLLSARVFVLVEGRQLCELDLELGLGPLLVVVEDPRLRPDERWSQVVQDADYEAVVAELVVAAKQLFDQLCATYTKQRPTVARWLARVLVHAAAQALARGEDWTRETSLDQLPLLDTLSGSTLSLAQAQALRHKHGKLEWVDRETSWAALNDPEILKLEEDEAAWVGSLIATELVDGSLRVRRQAVHSTLESRPVMSEATLDPATVFTIETIRAEGRIGEVGISRTQTKAGIRLRLGTAGRLVQNLEIPASGVWLPLEASILDDELVLDAKGEVDSSAKRYRRLLRQIRRSAADLVLALCGRWSQMERAEQREAWRILMLHLEAEAEVERGKTRDAVFERAREVPGFCDLWGRRYSLAQLQERGTKQALRALARRRPKPPELTGRPLILLLSEAEIDCLEDGFDFDVELLDDTWDAELRWLESLANAPLIERPDFDTEALVHRKAQAAGGISCELWLPVDYSPLTPLAEPLQLLVDLEGLAITGISLLETLPCAGILSGAGIELHADSLALEPRQRSSLVRQILIVYLELAEALRGDKLTGARHTRGLEYMAWIDMCAEYGVAEFRELDGDKKRVRELLRAALELTPPTLRESLRRAVVDAEAGEGPREEDFGDLEVADASLSESEVSEWEISESEQTIPHTNREVADEAREAATPEPAQSDPRSRLLTALYEQLHWARARHGQLLDDLRLAQLTISYLDSGTIAEIRVTGIVINAVHPLVDRLLGQARHDLIDLSFLVTTLYSLMNHAAEEITDDDERLFVAQFAESLTLSLRAHTPD